MFYVENGHHLHYFLVPTKEEAIAEGRNTLGDDHPLRAWPETASLSVIDHQHGYMVSQERIGSIYSRMLESLEVQWWGSAEPGVTIMDQNSELVSVVFGTSERAQEISEDMIEKISTTNYHSY